MKNMKKLISLTLALALLLSSMTVAFAAVDQDVMIAKAIGMIKGEGDGVTEDYADSIPTRAQAALMQLRLMGLEEEATDYTYVEGITATFTDAGDVDDFWQPILAYLKANPELGWEGYEDGSFMPNEYVSFIEYAKVLLTAMGYEYGKDFSWDDEEDGVVAFAKSLGIDEQTGVFDITALCEATVDALVASTKDNSTLIAKLVEAKVIDLDDALETGLIVLPEDLGVVTANMPNLAQIIITFNKDLDSDMVKSIVDDKDWDKYFKVENDTDNRDATILDAEVDGSIVTLKLDYEDVDIQDDVDLTITDDLLDEEEKIDIDNVLDVTLPTVVGVETSGPDQFEIIFSEPLSVEPDIELNDGEIGAEAVDFKVGDVKVTIEANDDLDPGDTYELVITDAKDYADYKMLKYTTNEKYRSVDDELTVEVKDVTETTVTIVFSEDLDADSVDAVEDKDSEIFWHSFSSYEPLTVTAVDDSSKEFKIEFADAETKKGHFVPYADITFSVESTYDDGDEDITDVWGNKMDGDYETKISSEKDTKAPTVRVVKATEEEIIVAYSEDVDGADDKDNITIKDGDDEIEINNITYDSKKDEYTIDFKKDVDGGEYTIEFKDIKDGSLAANKMDPNPTKITVTINDSKAPDLSKATAIIAGNYKVYVTYPEAMDDSVIDEDMYTATSGTGVNAKLVVPEKAEFFGSSNKEVKLTFDEDVKITTGDSMLVVGKVADASGNRVQALSTPVTISAIETVAIKEVKTISENRMSVTIEGKIPAGNVDNDYISVSNGGVSAVAAAIKDVDYDSKDDETTIVFSLKSAITVGAAETDFVVEISPEMEDDKGFAVTSAAFVGAKDGVAPSYVKYVTGTSIIAGSTTEVALVFDENIVSTYQTLIAIDLAIKMDGDKLKVGEDYETAVGTVEGVSAVAISFLNDKYDPTEFDMTIETVDNPAFIRDKDGNQIDELDEIKIKASKW